MNSLKRLTQPKKLIWLKNIGVFATFLSLTFVLGCGNEKRFDLISKKFTEDIGDTTYEGESCSTIHKQQPKEQITKKVDILLVADTSGSLHQERASVAKGIDDFIEGLGPDVDFQVGVMLAHGESQYAGALFQAFYEPAVLDSKKLSRDQIRNHLNLKLTNVKPERVTDGGEAGLYSLHKALTSPLHKAQIQSQGFLRWDAALAVVFISDENDICAKYPSGITPVPDGDSLEAPAFQKFCKNKVNQFVVYEQLKRAVGEQPLVISSIIYTDPNQVPRGTENEVGYGFLEITKLNNGKLIDIGNDDIGLGLKSLGELTQSRLKLITEFQLPSSNPILEPTIRVTVDDIPVRFQFVASTRSVLIDKVDAGRADSRIQINYCSLSPGSN